MANRFPVVRKDGQNVQIPTGDSLLLRGALNEAPIARLFSRIPVDLGATSSNVVNFVYWDSTISSFGTAPLGTRRTLIRTGSDNATDPTANNSDTGPITLVHSATLRLPGAANIVMVIGDSAEFVSLGGGAWFCDWYKKADGTALVSSGGGTSPSSTDALPEGTTNLYFTNARARSATRFTWDQSTAMAVWTVPHNTNGYPSVTVVDTLGNVVTPDISYVDANTVQITHGAAYAGKAYIN